MVPDSFVHGESSGGGASRPCDGHRRPMSPALLPLVMITSKHVMRTAVERRRGEKKERARSSMLKRRALLCLSVCSAHCRGGIKSVTALATDAFYTDDGYSWTSWTSQAYSGTLAVAPIGRMGAALWQTNCASPNPQYIYLWGGWPGSGPCNSLACLQVHKLDLNNPSSVWSALVPNGNPPPAMRYFTTTIISSTPDYTSYLHMCGGILISTGVPTNECWRTIFSGGTVAWQQLVPAASFPGAMWGAQIVQVKYADTGYPNYVLSWYASLLCGGMTGSFAAPAPYLTAAAAPCFWLRTDFSAAGTPSESRCAHTHAGRKHEGY